MRGLPRGAVTIPPPPSPVLRLPSNVRLRGTNIVPTDHPLGNPYSTYAPTIWGAMWVAWDWNGWIKPQIDDAATIGNTVRLWGGAQAFLSGAITEATYLTRWQQLLDYCAGKGLYMIPTGDQLLTNPTPIPSAPYANNFTTSTAAAHYATWGKVLAQYPGVVGVDLMNEAWGMPNRGFAGYNWIVTALRACADAMRSNGLPVTASFPLPQGSAASRLSWTGAAFSTYPIDPFWQLSDYLDIHIYDTTVTAALIANAYNFSWATGKPMIFGEFGLDISATSTARTAFYNMTQPLVTARSDNAGALAWSCYDVGSGNQYGLYSAPGVLRTDISVPFATFPTTR